MKKFIFKFVFAVAIFLTITPLFTIKASAANDTVGGIDATARGISIMINGCPIDPDTDTKSEIVGYRWFANCEQTESSANAWRSTPLGTVMNFTTGLYDNKPASSVAWARYEFNKLAGKNYAFAQSPEDTDIYRPGTGFTLLQPLQGLWAWSRNLTYVAFIILIIVIGFMILFRNQLDGGTPITIFNSIPTMILSLVLITFSYPITSFFIDVITVGTNLTQSVMLSTPGAPGYESIWRDDTKWNVAIPVIQKQGQAPVSTVGRNNLQPDDPWMSVWQIFNTSGASLCKDAEGGAKCDISNLLPDNIGAGNAIGQIVQFVISFAQGTGVDNTLVSIVLGFAAFSAAIKLFLSLLNKYIVLTVGVILAPWYFFIAALPSKSQSTIVDFLKMHLGAALSFVAIYAVFLFLIIFVKTPTTANLTWIPPLMGYNADQIVQGNVLGGLIAFGIFLATPSIPDMIDKIFDIPSGSEVAQAIGERVTGAAQGAAGYGRMVAGTFAPGFMQRFK